mmetsp:Transcript_18885/g.31406  ORF Transcript_18885/g.31406 Transcript_18885/m.31406 type:complete len:91 (+) Transcript_18885:52-324(+)
MKLPWCGVLLWSTAMIDCNGWFRECEIACKNYTNWKDSLAEVKDLCERDLSCPAVVDFSANDGFFAVCQEGTGYRRWSKVCVEKKNIEEL